MTIFKIVARIAGLVSLVYGVGATFFYVAYLSPTKFQCNALSVEVIQQRIGKMMHISNCSAVDLSNTRALGRTSDGVAFLISREGGISPLKAAGVVGYFVVKNQPPNLSENEQVTWEQHMASPYLHFKSFSESPPVFLPILALLAGVVLMIKPTWLLPVWTALGLAGS